MCSRGVPDPTVSSGVHPSVCLPESLLVSVLLSSWLSKCLGPHPLPRTQRQLVLGAAPRTGLGEGARHAMGCPASDPGLQIGVPTCLFVWVSGWRVLSYQLSAFSELRKGHLPLETETHWGRHTGLGGPRGHSDLTLDLTHCWCPDVVIRHAWSCPGLRWGLTEPCPCPTWALEGFRAKKCLVSPGLGLGSAGVIHDRVWGHLLACSPCPGL